MICKVLENLLEGGLRDGVLGDVRLCLKVLNHSEKVPDREILSWNLELVEVSTVLNQLYTAEGVR